MEVAPMAQSLTLIERPGSQQTAISLGMSGPSRSHADYHPLRLANQVFGGGASSRLFMELRERRSLTYGAYSMLDCGLWAGDLTASLSCAVDKSLEAVQALQAEVRRMADGVVDESDLDHARRYLIGSFPQRASGVAGVASLCNAGWLHSLPADTWSRYQAELSAVPSEAVVQASRDWFRPELAALVIVGAGEALDAVQGPLENEGLPVVRTDMSDTRFEGPHP
jgi:zinc protease